MWKKVRSWDNRKETKAKRLPTINGRIWTRRIAWYEDETTYVKLKLEDGEEYREVCVVSSLADILWSRFRDGASLDDCCSIFGKTPHSPSRRTKEK